MALVEVSGVRHFTAQPGDALPRDGVTAGSTLAMLPLDSLQPIKRFVFDGLEWHDTAGVPDPHLVDAVEMLTREFTRLRLGMIAAGTCKEVK